MGWIYPIHAFENYVEQCRRQSFFPVLRRTDVHPGPSNPVVDVLNAADDESATSDNDADPGLGEIEPLPPPPTLPSPLPLPASEESVGPTVGL